MKQTVFIRGILPAIVTPLCENNRTVNESVAKDLIEYQLSAGANGFYVLGGTGEGPVICPDERKRMCEIAVRQVAGRVPVIVHIAAMNMEEAIALARHAERAGADAIAAIPPLFFSYDAEDLYQYYRKLANSVSIPLIIYYHPSAQKNMSAELIAKLFTIDNITGVKWSSVDLYEMMRLKSLTQGDMNIINGPDELLVCGLAAGADAGIGSTYNVMLPEFIQIYRLFCEGRVEEARAVQFKVNRVIGALLAHELIPAVKYAVSLRGFEMGDATFPMKQLGEEEKRTLSEQLRQAGWPLRKR